MAAVGSTATGQVSLSTVNPSASQGYADDPIFGDQSAAIQRALSDYQANLQAQREQIGQTYSNATDDIGRTYEHTKENTVNDFADRGMLNSGLFGKQYDQNQSDYQRGLNSAAQTWTNGLTNLNQGYSDFQSQEQVALNQAKADAVARAASKIGIGVN